VSPTLYCTYVHYTRKIRSEDKGRQEGALPAGALVGAGGCLPGAPLAAFLLQGRKEECGTRCLARKTGWARGRQASVALPVVAAGRLLCPALAGVSAGVRKRRNNFRTPWEGTNVYQR